MGLSRWPSLAVACLLLLLALCLTNLASFSRRIDVATASSSSSKESGADENVDVDANADAEADAFLNTTWPPLQRVLCGEGAPNLMLAQQLFERARQEVFSVGNNNRNNNSNQSSIETTERSLYVPTRPFDLKNRSFHSSDGKPTETLRQFFAGEFGKSSVFHGWNGEGGRFATIYARIWKCGNNQIRWMEPKLFKKYNGTYTQMYLWQALGDYFPSLYQTAESGGVAGANASTDPLMPPPCIYTAVRDPISHFLSGYNEVEVRQLGEYNNGSSSDFPSHATPAPYHLAVPYSNASSFLRKQRFRAFVEDLLLEEEVFGSHFVYQHFFSMSRVLVSLARTKARLTGYIPGLENITETWPDFMSSTCEGFPPRSSISKMKTQGQHRSSKDRLGLYIAAKEVWGEAGPLSRALCLLHAFDYACYEDLPGGIPEVCRDVYTDHSREIVRFGSKNYLTYTMNKVSDSKRP